MTSMAPVAPPSAAPRVDTDLTRTARTTGAFYLAFCVAGIVGNYVLRTSLCDSGDAGRTLSHLADHVGQARVAVAFELGIALAQALTAVWFYRSFCRVDAFAAGSLAAFGLVNAVMILCTAAMEVTALDVARDSSLSVAGDAAATVQLLYVVSDHLWDVAASFFGLWLLPMGWLVLRSGWLPRALGWVLLIGGTGIWDRRVRRLDVHQRRYRQPAPDDPLDRRRAVDHGVPPHQRSADPDTARCRLTHPAGCEADSLVSARSAPPHPVGQESNQRSRRNRSTRRIENPASTETEPSRAMNRASDTDFTSSHFA
jgi:hypothetical protein